MPEYLPPVQFPTGLASEVIRLTQQKAEAKGRVPLSIINALKDVAMGYIQGGLARKEAGQKMGQELLTSPYTEITPPIQVPPAPLLLGQEGPAAPPGLTFPRRAPETLPIPAAAREALGLTEGYGLRRIEKPARAGHIEVTPQLADFLTTFAPERKTEIQGLVGTTQPHSILTAMMRPEPRAPGPTREQRVTSAISQARIQAQNEIGNILTTAGVKDWYTLQQAFSTQEKRTEFLKGRTQAQAKALARVESEAGRRGIMEEKLQRILMTGGFEKKEAQKIANALSEPITPGEPAPAPRAAPAEGQQTFIDLFKQALETPEE